jgi:hypothetical protein
MKYPKSIIEVKSSNNIKNEHPTQKPLELMEYLVKTYTNEGDMVLDNTMGSGTTNLACIKKIEKVNWNRKGKTILRCRCSEGFGVLPLTARVLAMPALVNFKLF